MHGSIEVTIFSRLYAQVRDLLEEDRAIMLMGTVQRDDNSVKVLCEEIIPMEAAEEKWIATIHMHLPGNATDRETLVRLRELLVGHPGSCRGFIHVPGPEGSETIIALPDTMRIEAGGNLNREIRSLLGPHGVTTQCGAIANGNGDRQRNGRHLALG